MKRPPFILAASLFLFAASSLASDEGIDYRANLYSPGDFLMRTLPGIAFYPSFLENYAPDATLLIEESNGFSLIDPPRVYYEGDPCSQFSWSYERFRINSSLNGGTPGIIPPIMAVGRYALGGESPMARDAGFHFLPVSKDRSFSRIRLSTAGSGLGGTVPWATTAIDPHATSKDRNTLLHSARRKILSDYDLDALCVLKGRSSAFSFALSAFDIRRLFNDFNTIDGTFTERGKGLLLSASYERTLKSGSLFLTGVYNGLRRDHALAEFGRLPQETRDEDRESYFTGMRLREGRWSLALSYLREHEDLTPNTMNFLKDLKDNDGEGMFPFERFGSFASGVFRMSLDLSLLPAENGRTSRIDLFADVKSAALTGTERAFDFDPLSFDRTPEAVILWSGGGAYRNTNQEIKAGALMKVKLTPLLSFVSRLVVQHSRIRFQDSANDLSFFAPGFDVGFVLFRNPEILISYEQAPYELREDVNFFLETRRPGGTIRQWQDRNGDLAYQPGEEGPILGYTGGPFHAPASGLKMPMKKRVLVLLTAPISKAFTLSIKGLYKRIDRNLQVRFKEDYGFYEEINRTSLFFFDAPFREYALANDSFSPKPFYAQLLFQIASRANKTWFFSFSFLAHMGMGRTAFGNGAGANDIGILSESEAHPNSWINAFGRVDGDRAYLAKLFFGLHVTRDLTLGVDLKYRDGTPFAFLQTVRKYDQRVFYYKTIKAEDDRGIKGGPRKDYLSDMSVQLRYGFKLFGCRAEADLGIFNLLDFGSELSEYVFSGGWRYANELQIPRSFRAGFSVEF